MPLTTSHQLSLTKGYLVYAKRELWGNGGTFTFEALPRLDMMSRGARITGKNHNCPADKMLINTDNENSITYKALLRWQHWTEGSIDRVERRRKPSSHLQRSKKTCAKTGQSVEVWFINILLLTGLRWFPICCIFTLSNHLRYAQIALFFLFIHLSIYLLFLFIKVLVAEKNQFSSTGHTCLIRTSALWFGKTLPNLDLCFFHFLSFFAFKRWQWLIQRQEKTWTVMTKDKDQRVYLSKPYCKTATLKINLALSIGSKYLHLPCSLPRLLYNTEHDFNWHWDL